MQNVKPPRSTFVHLWYNVSAKLFVVGSKELLFHEGTTQGDPTAMAVDGISLAPLLKNLATCYPKKYPKSWLLLII